MALRDHNKQEENLRVVVRDRFKSCRTFPVDDSGSNEDGKNKEEQSRNSVFETGESPQIHSSKPNPTSYPLETNSNPFYTPGQPETSSRNCVIMRASSLVQIWEARSSSSLSQSLPNSRTSSGLSFSTRSNSSSFSEFLNDEARKNNESSGEEIDWFPPQSDMSNVSNSYENDREGRCFLEPATCTPRIRGRQASEDVYKMILRDRENELEWLVDRNAVSKFSPRGFSLQFMLRIRSLERCIAIQERCRSKSATSDVNRSSRGSSENQDAAYKQEIASSNNNGSKKPEVERKPTEGEGLRNDTGLDKFLVSITSKESEETNKCSLSIAEKVNLWDSKERADRRTTVDLRRDFEEYRINPQEIKSVVCLDRRNEEETASHVFRESKEEKSLQNDEETAKAEKQETSETLCLILETPISISDWDKNETEYKENQYYNGETVYHDWITDISRPRSYWEALKKQREDEVINKNSEKDDMRNLIKIRIVSSFLVGDFREKIDKIMVSCVERRLKVESNLVEEDSEVSLIECSARYQGNLEENETDLEPITVSDGFSQHLLIAATIYLNPKDHENSFSETQMIIDLRKQIKQLRREMLELQSLVKSCADFQKSMKCLCCLSEICS